MKDFLKDKHVVITGISKGIGKCLTEQLLAAGVSVTGWGIHPPDISHPHLRFISCDISKESSVLAAAKATREKGIPVDFLINNAGFGYFNKIEDFSTERFQQMWEVNVRGAFLVTRALVPEMQKRKSGHIINISSIAGRVGAPSGTGYNTSKWALSGMSESWFHELRKQGIKVSTVYPGSTQTGFFDEIPSVEPHENMLDPEEVAHMILQIMNTSPNFLVREIEVRPLNGTPPG